MAPSSISDAFAVVPPMSKASRLSTPSCSPIPSAATTPAAGPGLEREDRPLLRVLRSHHAAGRLHDLQRPVDPIPSRPRPDPVDVAAHQRPHVGVHDRRRGALVLALLAQDLARERDVRLRELLGQDRAEAQLVLGVEVGVEEADRDGLDPRLAQAAGERAALVLVDGRDDGARPRRRARSARSGGAVRRAAAACARRGRTCAGSAAGAARARRGSRRS